MLQDLKIFFKMSIVNFVIISAIAGYGIGHTVEQNFDLFKLILFLVGTFGISAGSLSLNQVQEVFNDKLMERTQVRPLVKGSFSRQTGLFLSLSLMCGGLIILYTIKPLTFVIGLGIILMYNGLYTLYWKKNWAFAAVPGAVPGALPGVLGFSVVNDNILSPPSIYLFLVMFLWQMPHFWSLAIRYADDYTKGKFPVLPAIVGSGRTKYHISFYVWAYVLLGIMSPFFVDASYAYFILVLPFSVLMLWQFLRYFRSEQQKSWLPFFLVTNFSMLAYMFAPLIDKYIPLLFEI
ncbi:MAG: protoheme IX farnesyltransferase [Halobacteriovoraceae bacterium]|jgi:protoheme IX farnesyltransferase|nr:protoheme IX farnesyltransferase [Halobacteriovoraceae bacterium]